MSTSGRSNTRAAKPPRTLSESGFAPGVSATYVLDTLYEELLLGAPMNVALNAAALEQLRSCRGYDFAASRAAEAAVRAGGRQAAAAVLSELTHAAGEYARLYELPAKGSLTASGLADIELVRSGGVLVRASEDGSMSGKELELREDAYRVLERLRAPLERMVAGVLLFALDVNAWDSMDERTAEEFCGHHVRAYARELRRLRGLDELVELVGELQKVSAPAPKRRPARGPAGHSRARRRVAGERA